MYKSHAHTHTHTHTNYPIVPNAMITFLYMRFCLNQRIKPRQLDTHKKHKPLRFVGLKMENNNPFTVCLVFCGEIVLCHLSINI